MVSHIGFVVYLEQVFRVPTTEFRVMTMGLWGDTRSRLEQAFLYFWWIPFRRGNATKWGLGYFFMIGSLSMNGIRGESWPHFAYFFTGRLGWQFRLGVGRKRGLTRPIFATKDPLRFFINQYAMSLRMFSEWCSLWLEF